MAFWVIAGLLALAVGALLLMALLRTPVVDAEATASDIQVYRDQLAEVERDLARGVVSEDEAERVRIEVSRRLLEADKAAGTPRKVAPVSGAASGIAAAMVALIVVAGAGALYATMGAPGYGDVPLMQRLTEADAAHKSRPSQADMEARQSQPFMPDPSTPAATLELIEKLRVAVRANPEELQGYVFLAESEARLGNFKAAHKAQGQLIALKGETAAPEDFTTHAILMILATNEYVSPEAEAALKSALDLEPRNGWARYYLGQMYVQAGRPDLTFRIWRPLLAESLPGAPWVSPIAANIELVAQEAGIPYTPPPPATDLAGPTAEDMQAAAEMDADARMEMIKGMVDGLSERLATEGGSAEEWAQLITALGVLGNTERAGAIWTEAQAVFADHPEQLQTVQVAARRAGVAE